VTKDNKMRIACLTILAGFLIGLFNSAQAQTAETAPLVCDESKKVFDLLKKRRFYPVIIGESENLQTAIFLNVDRDMIVAITMEESQKHITCIFLGGEKNTQIFSLPSQQEN